MVYATLSNSNRPGSPAVTVGFPITENVYADLESIGIGNATERDCYAASVGGDILILKRLEKTAVNVDELDYLVKRLDSFDRRELAQFQGVAVSRGYFDMTDLINLTFCCQSATVVQDFSDLASIGRAHYLDIHGGATAEELQSVDARKLALSLLLNKDGKVTPYGVVYDNGMQLEQLYDGQHFPDYLYNGNTVLTAAMTDRRLSEDTALTTWLHFPMNDWQIERAVIRTGISVPEDMRLRYSDSELPQELTALLDSENLHDVNDLCAGFAELDQGDRQKLGAILQMVRPDALAQARNLLKQLDLFDFIPKVSTPAEYGRYMIAESGRFEYDENLDEFYDYQKYGKQRMLPDHEPVTGEPDELAAARGELGVTGWAGAVLLEAKCCLWNIMNPASQYATLEQLIDAGNNLGYVLEEQGQGMPCFDEYFRAAMELEGCTRLDEALDISQNLNCYDFIPLRNIGKGSGDGLPGGRESSILTAPRLRTSTMPDTASPRSNGLDSSAARTDISPETAGHSSMNSANPPRRNRI